MAREWWLVPGDAHALRYPDVCVCCDKRTAERWDVVPYCPACRAHVPRFGPWAIAIAAAVAGGATAFALHTFAAFASWPVHFVVPALAAFALPVAALFVRKRVGPPHADDAQAAEITREGLLVRSERWANRVADLNGREARSTIESSFAILDRLLPFIAALLPIAFVVYWYPHWHTTLWIDNGTSAPVTVRADDHELATVAAGARVELSIPRGELRITSTAGDEVKIDPNVESGAWVLNVARAHCYELHTYGYAKNDNALFLGDKPRRYGEGLFNVSADWFFRAPPSTITVREGTTIAGIAETRSALQIATCPRF